MQLIALDTEKHYCTFGTDDLTCNFAQAHILIDAGVVIALLKIHCSSAVWTGETVRWHKLEMQWPVKAGDRYCQGMTHISDCGALF